MPHIVLNSADPGIRGLLRYRPETARPLSELREVLLRGPSILTRGERELIAACVSALNGCRYCASSHSACAAAQLPGLSVWVSLNGDVGSMDWATWLTRVIVNGTVATPCGMFRDHVVVAGERICGFTDGDGVPSDPDARIAGSSSSTAPRSSS
jgi:hypothetical protein